MRLHTLIISAAAACLLAGGSGAALAEGCGDGILVGEYFDGNLVVRDQESCTIIGSVIVGNLRVRNVDNLLLLNNTVGGNLRVIRTEGQEGLGLANVVANTVVTGNIAVLEYGTGYVIENETFNGNIRVIGNTTASVQKNISANDLRCRSNTTLTAFLNLADGIDTCTFE